LGSFQEAVWLPQAEEIGWQGNQTHGDEKHPTGVCKVYHEVVIFVKLLGF
jgi:hypothetical protein